MMPEAPIPQAPFAASLRPLRAPARVARAAATDLAMLVGLLDDDDGSSLGLVGLRVREVADRWRERWPDTDVNVAGWRTRLGPLGASATALEAEIARLRALQHEAMHAPERAEHVAAIRALAVAVDEARGHQAELSARASAISALLDALSEPAEPTEAWQRAARASFEGMLAHLSLSPLAPEDAADDWLAALRTRALAAQEAERHALSAATARADELAAAMEAVLG